MRKRAELVALISLVIVILALSSLSRPPDGAGEQQSPERIIRSSYKTYPDGYLALYLTLDELKLRPQRQIRPLSMLPDRGVLLAMDPYRTEADAKEGRDLMAWVARGNYALIAVEHHPEFLDLLAGANATRPAAPEPPNPLVESAPDPAGALPVTLSSVETTSARAVSASSPFGGSLPALRVRSSFRFPARGGILPPALRTLAGGEPAPLYRDAHGLVAAYSPIGRGGIVWCCSPWSFSNAGLTEGGNLDFVLALINRQPSGPVLFDEYHHGYGAGMTVIDLLPTLGKTGLAQLLLALALLCLLLAWRFGPYRLPAGERYTRSRAEYLTSMAGLLQRARATPLVRDRLTQHLRRELGRRLGLPAHTPLPALRDANAAHPAVDAGALAHILQQLAVLESQSRPDQEVLFRLTGDVHRLLQRKRSV